MWVTLFWETLSSLLQLCKGRLSKGVVWACPDLLPTAVLGKGKHLTCQQKPEGCTFICIKVHHPKANGTFEVVQQGDGYVNNAGITAGIR